MVKRGKDGREERGGEVPMAEGKKEPKKIYCHREEEEKGKSYVSLGRT